MSSTPFGDLLKRERELRGVSLEEISAATRINTRYLEALESETWSNLPGGVFNRGFIRSVAHFLGLDEDNLVAEYQLHMQSEQATHVVAIPYHKTDRRALAGIAILAVVVATLVAGGWFGVTRYKQRIASLLHRKDGASAGSEAFAGVPRESTARQTEASATTAPDSAPLELKMEAGKPTDAKVIADGQTVFDGHVEAGETRSFDFRENVQVLSGEASALLLELDGQTIPPIGQPGEPGSVYLTRNDLKNPAGGPH